MFHKLWGLKVPRKVPKALNFHNICYIIYMIEINIYFLINLIKAFQIYKNLCSIM